MPDYIAHFREWDQSKQTLESHLLGVSNLASQFAAKLGLREHGELIGLLHDLGKYSDEFQNYLKSAVNLLNQDEDEEFVDALQQKGKVDHSTAGAQYLFSQLHKKGNRERAMGQVLALCVASHHSGLIDCISADVNQFGEDIFSKRMNKTFERTHLTEVIDKVDNSILSRCESILKDTQLIESFTTVMSRIAERNKGSQYTVKTQMGLAIRFLFSCLIDADRIDTADFEHRRASTVRPLGKYTEWNILIERLENKLSTFGQQEPIADLRSMVSEDCLAAASRPRGIYTLTVPTGGGKTLASLRFALHHSLYQGLDRIIYVIPFTSIIDQNAQVVREILEPNDDMLRQGKIVLEHHSSITPEKQNWREKMLCENWDAPVVYTTMVQLLESLFGFGTRGARRMHQLANSVLIFDEIQTLPIKCVHLFNNAINFLAEQCQSTVLLCTATQPLLHRVNEKKGAIRLSENHEIIKNVPRLFHQLKRVEVSDLRKPGGFTYEEIAQLAKAEWNRTGSCLVIVNTKEAAKKIYQLCMQDLNDGLTHLSTDMCATHRKQELAKIRERLKSEQKLPVLCISTPLIEAGVDIDFQVVIRFSAGLDSIAQAAGRCNRNGKLKSGIVYIVNPKPSLENLDKLLDIKKGRDCTLRILDEYRANPQRYHHHLFGTEAMTEFYRYYFSERKEEMAYQIIKQEMGFDSNVLELLSGNDVAVQEYQRRFQHTEEKTNLSFQQAFMTAAKAFQTIDAPTQGILVPYGEGKQIINKLHGSIDLREEFILLRAAQQYTVNVFPHVLQKLNQIGAVYELSQQNEQKREIRIVCLREQYYSQYFGLATEPVSQAEVFYVSSIA